VGVRERWGEERWWNALVPPIRWNRRIPNLKRIFIFEEPDSIPLAQPNTGIYELQSEQKFWISIHNVTSLYV
jgi:hypothetical protein